jgi:PmbA protein
LEAKVPELSQRAADAVTLAKTAGADAVWARATRSREVEFTGRDGSLEKVQENTSRKLSIDLYVDGRYSSHSTTSLRPERLQTFIDEAVALTRALQPDEHRALPDPSLFEGRSDADLALLDPAVDALTTEQRQAWLDAIDGAARTDDRVISAMASCSSTKSDGAMAGSNGFAGDWSTSQVWIGASVTMRDEGDSRPEAGRWIGARRLDQLYGGEQLAKEALELAISRLGSKKGPTERTTMIVDPHAGGRLIGRLLGAATARSVSQGRSFWAGKEGEQLFGEALTVVDEPLMAGGLGSRHFDSEGIASKALPIVEGGVVKNLYVDTYYGKKAGLTPTTGSRSNVVVKSTVDKDLAGLLEDVGEGIYVTSWLGGNSDGTTGDYSFGLRGHQVHKGQIGPPVGEMNITGNLAELFAQLVLVGNDPSPYRSTQVPTLVFKGVQFSGV